MGSLPKSAGAIEKAYPNLRNDSETFYEYMKKIPFTHIETLYKKSEVQAEIMSGILNAFAEHGTVDNESIKHSAEFLLSLSKSSNFDMTLMFIDDVEKAHVKKIKKCVSKLGDSNLQGSFDKVFGDL